MAVWVRPPREWQEAAFADYTSRMAQNYLAAVCPGGGKTEFALAVASHLLQSGSINFVVVVSPSDALTKQWADKAALFGIPLSPEVHSKSPWSLPRDFKGISTTYQLLAAPGSGAPSGFSTLMQMRHVLVIFDEAHHAGEKKAWGEALTKAFELARHRLLLTGTPKRSDTSKIPFATYTQNEKGIARIVRDYNYGTGRGVRDQVIRRLDTRFYDAEVNELAFGEKVPVSANISDAVTQADRSKFMGAVIDPDSGWFSKLLPEVDRELQGVRQSVPNAGCLILANSQEHVKAYARLVKQVTGHDAVTVTSDDPAARLALEKFAHSDAPYIIAVRMVSEGVDIPRLRVLVWLTRTKTELFFAQGTARVVRIPDPQDTTPAVVFMPALDVLRELAQGIEDDIDHEIDLLEQQAKAEQAAARADSTEGSASPIDGLDDEPPSTQLLLGTSFSIDNLALESTLFGPEAHEAQIHHAAQQIIDEDGLPQIQIALIRKLIDRGRIVLPGIPTPDQHHKIVSATQESPNAQDALWRVRNDLKVRLHTRAKYLARRYFNDDFKMVRNRINQETGARADYGTTDQLHRGLNFAEEWARNLEAGKNT
ncbi:DEAD/DEAH box helicase [Streptomyces sp. AK02-01A]|uniref:DEAD/DEAH box helicase n=1 Tax=Streptomyces sp. AK02-01A TaxID=3028648 RepID=UPI0029AE119C|nr:DEAD/DEAH box helicase family protein [Streptomyces sp. AK02-01A]MDX3855929.1 DEAD/DEAH box helicase family protein [Streptomyces sp. AK02-01A]